MLTIKILIFAAAFANPHFGGGSGVSFKMARSPSNMCLRPFFFRLVLALLKERDNLLSHGWIRHGSCSAFSMTFWISSLLIEGFANRKQCFVLFSIIPRMQVWLWSWKCKFNFALFFEKQRTNPKVWYEQNFQKYPNDEIDFLFKIRSLCW